MAIIEKIKKFVKDVTPPSKEQKAKIEEKQMKMEEMKDPEAYRKNKAMYDVSTEVKKFDENYKKGGKITAANYDKEYGKIYRKAVKKMSSGGSVGSASKRADGIAVKGKTRGKIC
jgi:L-lactate utilization protein LutB